MIWGCLDTGRLLDGAVRLLRAREVHRRLRTERQGAEVAARFPLLVPLWPGVEKFRCGPQTLDPRPKTLLCCSGSATERQTAEVAARFPLLVPLWPGVGKFRCGLRFPML